MLRAYFETLHLLVFGAQRIQAGWSWRLELSVASGYSSVARSRGSELSAKRPQFGSHRTGRSLLLLCSSVVKGRLDGQPWDTSLSARSGNRA